MYLKRKLQCKRGQSLVETALVLPIIILILMGIFDFGMMFNNYLIISNASREGARYAAVGATNTQIEAVVGSITGTLDISRITISVTPDESNRRKGNEITVSVTYDYDFITPIISAIITGPVHLNGVTVMRIE